MWRQPLSDTPVRYSCPMKHGSEMTNDPTMKRNHSEHVASRADTDDDSFLDGDGAVEREAQATSEASCAADTESSLMATPHADHAILIIEGDRFVDCNEAAVRMLGFMGRDDAC